MEKNNDGQHRTPYYGPDGSDTGQLSRVRDNRTRMALS
jgi:hypothetical protein